MSFKSPLLLPHQTNSTILLISLGRRLDGSPSPNSPPYTASRHQSQETAQTTPKTHTMATTDTNDIIPKADSNRNENKRRFNDGSRCCSRAWKGRGKQSAAGVAMPRGLAMAWRGDKVMERYGAGSVVKEDNMREDKGRVDIHGT
ncbi:hypothetical protein M758_12G082500 [Ceratodon purpureus]|uniref:Uncharacterized protein n=1 Tax=Ceratodon purpureus TaxID=3225 RepID=A0A8T0G5F3_CERPU|nr:hypothetical protein KC19_12G079900 [Ceratodon purpureus]KAG0598537.1 hypothetical protein M758_12G082500 [Ceratodon purpureus]